MATQFKFTAPLGNTDPAEIPAVAGDAEAQSDTISINIDQTNMSKGEALKLIESIVASIHKAPWPAL